MHLALLLLWGLGAPPGPSPAAAPEGTAPAAMAATAAMVGEDGASPAQFEDRITVTATRTETRLGDTAASVAVLTQRDLATAAAPALDDALRQVPGFTLFRRSGSRFANPTTQGATLRGLGGSGAGRALVLDDGVPLNDPFGGWVYWARVPRAALDRVEVLRGGASDLYGSEALAGVVQLVRRPVDSHLHLEASYGELDSAEGVLSLAGRRGAWGAMLAAGAAETGGYVLVAPAERGAVDVPADSRHATGELTLERAAPSGARLFLRASAFSERRGNGTPLQTNATEIRQASAGGDLPLGAGRLSARAWLAGQDYEQSFTAVEPGRGGERLIRLQEVPSDGGGASGQWSRALGGRHALVAGVEIEEVEGTSEETAFVGGAAGGPPADLRTAAGGRRRSGAFFVEDLVRLGPRATLTVGARFDRWENAGERRSAAGAVNPLPARAEDAVSPRLTLLVRAGDRWAWTAAAYRGFRAPTLNELYRAFRVGDVVTLANEELRAERLTGAEAGARFSAAPGRLAARGTLFWMEVDDTVANVTLAVAPGLVTRRRENLGRSRSRGLEVDAEGRLGDRWTLAGGYLLADAEVVRFPADRALEGLRLPQVPRRQASLQLRFEDPRLAAGLQARWTDAQFDDDQNRLRLAPATIVDLLLSRALPGGLTVFAAAENLLDERVEIGRTPVLTLGPPRLFRAGLRFSGGRR